ncbi:hypothetical protein DB31_0795 [Hyalangium minutum]|uniref:Uncharacterized protein n=1 Tax=Hyalangium minutum TaxID=394096 RepID=A0A085WF59_9BACT|nr:hypothetical protein DB31_0795 [Hyalangium minutum]
MQELLLVRWWWQPPSKRGLMRSEAHKTALKFADPSLKVVVIDWC